MSFTYDTGELVTLTGSFTAETPGAPTIATVEVHISRGGLSPSSPVATVNEAGEWTAQWRAGTPGIWSARIEAYDASHALLGVDQLFLTVGASNQEIPGPEPRSLWPSPLLFPSDDLFPGAEQPIAAVVSWTPTLEQVAALASGYTTEGERDRSGEQPPDGAQATFTTETIPTAALVNQMIASSVKEVAGRARAVRATTDPAYATDPTGLNKWGDLASEAAAWLTVMKIDRERISAQADDADSGFRTAERQFLGLMNELADKASRVQPGMV